MYDYYYVNYICIIHYISRLIGGSMEDSDWVVVQRFYVIHPSGDVYEEKYKQQERWETRKKSSSHALMHSKYVYDRLCDGKTTKWSVMKDRVNGHSNQVLPSDEYLFMLILSARSVKDYVCPKEYTGHITDYTVWKKYFLS